MKKYTLVLPVLALILLGFSEVRAANCAPGDLFSSVTGQPCSMVNVDNGSENEDSVVSAFNAIYKSTFKMGSRGNDIKTLQQFLKNEGYYFGRVDGKYGRITDRAINDFKDDNGVTIVLPKVPVTSDPQIFPCTTASNSASRHCIINENSPVINGVKGPQSLIVNQQGTWTVSAYSKIGGDLSYSVVWGDEAYTSYMKPAAGQSATFTHAYTQAGTFKPVFTVTSESTIYCIQAPCPSNKGSAQASLTVKVVQAPTTSGITVLSPNGGETWTSGTKQTIKWQDNTSTPCPGTSSGLVCVKAPSTYDIFLNGVSNCSGEVCTLGFPTYTIARNVYGSSRDWTVGGVQGLYDALITEGSYNIQVCQTNTSVCDSSDSYFKIYPAIITY